MLSCTGQSIYIPTVVLLHPYSGCSAVQVSPVVVLLLYCCTHILHAQLYRSVELWSFCCIAAPTLCVLSYTGQSNCGSSFVSLHSCLFHIAHGLSLTDQKGEQEVK